MKNSRLSTILFFVFFQLFFLHCARETSEVVEPDTFQDTDTPDEINEWIEQQEASSTPLNELMLPNGQSIEAFFEEYRKKYPNGRIAEEKSPEYQKLLLIASMGEVAERLCNRTINHPAEAPNAPQHFGLAYSYGQVDYKVRAFPPGNPACPLDKPCPFRIFGLDCSGFITNLLREAKDPSTQINLFNSVKRVNAATQSTAEYWNEILKQNPRFEKVEMKKKGWQAVGNIEAGDIIYWPMGHIGYVYLGKDGKLKVFQSNGKSSDVEKRNGGPQCNDPKKSDCNCPGINYGACENNFSKPGRGVHEFSLTQSALNSFSSNYEVLRFTTQIEGKWTILLKCDWADDNNVAVTFGIDIPNTQDSKPFSAKGEGADYDGSTLYVDFLGTYDAISRKLKGRLTINSPGIPTPRMDDFETILPNDAKPTDWITLQSIQRESGTCIAQIKLERAITNGGKRKAAPILTKQYLF